MSTPTDQSPITGTGPEPDYATEHPPVVVATATEPAEPEPSADTAPAAAGLEQVDFNLVPPEHRAAFEARFHRLYFQLKQGQRERAEERKLYRGLDAKLDKYVNAQETDRQQSKIDLLTEKAQKLFGDGQHAEGIEVLKKIVKAERELPQTAKGELPPAPQPAAAPPFTEEEKQQLQTFAETNSWANAASPHFAQTKNTLSRFLARGISISEAIDATKEIMSEFVSQPGASGQNSFGKETPIAQAVLGANRTSQITAAKEPSLNEYEISVARKFWPRLKPEEAMAKYLKSKGGV